MNENAVLVWIPIVAMGGSFAMVVAVIWLVMRAKQRTAQYRAEVQMKMIDRFGTATEFVSFLESPAGRSFLQEPKRSTRERIVWGIRTGIILFFLGMAFAFAYFAERDPGIFIPAFILGGLGIGFILASVISLKLADKLNP